MRPLSTSRIDEPQVRDNFKALESEMKENPIMNGEWRLFDKRFDLTGTFPISHKLNFVPLDLIQTYSTATLSFALSTATDTTINVTVTVVGRFVFTGKDEVMATLLDLKTRVKQELDTEDEDFISAAELLGYIRRAVNSAENVVLTLYEDYFLAAPFTLTFVANQAGYDLPTNIYAQKIRKLIYDNSGTRYLVKRIKRIEETVSIESSEDYRYLITNDATAGVKLTLYPTPASSGQTLKLWYLRNAKELTLDADVLDIPEAYDYITQHVKDSCINKERMQPDAPKSAALTEEEDLLVSALTERFPDEDNIIEPDLGFYYGVN